MLFISLVKFKKKPTREIIADNLKLMKKEEKDGVKNRTIYWTLGRYDAVVITEAPNEKALMRTSIRRGDLMSTETLVAVPAEEARRLVE